MKRLCIFESHPVQYHAPVYRALHRLCIQSGNAEVRVLYATDATIRGRFDPGFARAVAWDEPLLEGYPATVLNNERSQPSGHFRSLSGKGVYAWLRQNRPDAVMLTNLAYEFDWTAYFAAMALRIPIWLRTETQDHAFARSMMKTLLRRMAYLLAYLPVRKAFVIGRLNGEHYARHGLSRRRHVLSPYCVVDRFTELSTKQKEAMRAALRNELAISPRQTVLLFCGKLQPKKNPMLLLDALAKLPLRARAGYVVLFVGSGELEQALRVRAAEIANLQVIFAGFQNQTELAKWYFAGDVLVLPSRQMGETWGLVANEALLAERRVIVSKHVGCHADFKSLLSVRVFDGSILDFLEALRSLPPVESTFGQREFMKRYSIEAAAEGIARAMGVLETLPPSIMHLAPKRDRTPAFVGKASTMHSV